MKTKSIEWCIRNIECFSDPIFHLKSEKAKEELAAITLRSSPVPNRPCTKCGVNEGEEHREGWPCSKPVPLCLWTQDNDGVWNTGCGQAHVFEAGTPGGNDFGFCPYCGKKLGESSEPVPQDEKESK